MDLEVVLDPRVELVRVVGVVVVQQQQPQAVVLLTLIVVGRRIYLHLPPHSVVSAKRLLMLGLPLPLPLMA